MCVACRIWCLADVLSVSPSSEQTINSCQYLTRRYIRTSHQPSARSLRQVMNQVKFCLLFMAQARSAQATKTRKEKRGSITCRTDRANEANKMFIIWLCSLFRERDEIRFDVLTSDQELEVCMATYGPEVDQSQHAKSVSHITKILIFQG